MVKPFENTPLVTFAILTYNQESFVRQAVRAAFVQEYERLEILISDDCSSDKTFQILQEEVKKYSGPHRVRLSRNQKNIGLIEHVNKIFELAKGVIIIASAGDDISYSNRTKRIVSEFAKTDALVVHSLADEIDLSGNRTQRLQPNKEIFEQSDAKSASLSDAIYLGASGCWSKDLYTIFGPLKYKHAYEDLTLGFRAILANRISHVPEPLLKYRVGDGLTTKPKNLETFYSIWRSRRAYTRVFYHTLMQRRDDCRKVGLPGDKSFRALDQALATMQWTHKFYEYPVWVPFFLLRSPLRFAKIIRTELSAIKRAYVDGKPKAPKTTR